MNAFGDLIRRLQDMAVGYAYSILGDFGLAEDATQEAFITAYRELASVREPNAFPSWVRRLVFTQCHRLIRGKHMKTVALEEARPIMSTKPNPTEATQTRELREQILAAIRVLPEKEREVTTLFYINGYSVAEVSEFLETPESTVKSHLHRARKKLKERMINMVAKTLKDNAPDVEKFSERILFRWKFRMNSPLLVHLGISEGLVADEDMVIVTDYNKDRYSIHVIETNTGVVKWSRSVFGHGLGPTSLRDGILYIIEKDHEIIALNVHAGTEEWRTIVTEDRPCSAAAADDHRVYFGGYKYVCALDRKTGAVLWKGDPQLSLDRAIADIPIAIAGTTVSVKTQCNTVCTFDAESGKLLWKHELDKGERPLLLVSERIAYVAGDRTLDALDRMTGTLRWRKESNVDYHSKILHDTNHQRWYFHDGGNSYNLFNEETGEIEETLRLPCQGHGKIAGDHIYLVRDNACYVIEKTGGTLLWRFAADSSLVVGPAVIGKHFYVASAQNILYALPGPTGINTRARACADGRLKKVVMGIENQEHHEAVATCREFVDNVEPGNVEAWLNLALSCENSGNKNEAIGAWHKVLFYANEDAEKRKIAEQHIRRLNGCLWVKRMCALPICGDGGFLHVVGKNKICRLDISTGNEISCSDTPGIANYSFLKDKIPVTDDLMLLPNFGKGVYAVEKDTGAVRWKFPVVNGGFDIAVSGDAAYIGYWIDPDKSKDPFTKVNLADGKVVWTVPLGTVRYPSAAIDGVIYVGVVDYGVYALNAHDGSIKWARKTLPGRHTFHGVPLPHADRLYVNVGGWGKEGFDKVVYALDKDTGEIVWEKSLGPEWGRISPGLMCPYVAVFGDTVYDVTKDTLYALNAATGEVRWQCREFQFTPSMGRIELYRGGLVLRDQHRLCVVDPAEGRLKASLSIHGLELWSHLLHDQMIYITAGRPRSEGEVVEAIPASVLFPEG